MESINSSPDSIGISTFSKLDSPIIIAVIIETIRNEPLSTCFYTTSKLTSIATTITLIAASATITLSISF